MVRQLERRAHDREEEKKSGRKGWLLLGVVLAVTAVLCLVAFKVLQRL